MDYIRNSGTCNLTTHAKSGGWAAKFSSVGLKAILDSLLIQDDPNLLVGFGTNDDACVYQLTSDIALVATVDIITPLVDDPYLFGQIGFGVSRVGSALVRPGNKYLRRNIHFCRFVNKIRLLIFWFSLFVAGRSLSKRVLPQHNLGSRFGQQPVDYSCSFHYTLNLEAP